VAGRIEGIEITTSTNDPKVLDWTVDWIKRLGHWEIRLPAAP
jgi:hypothetical protein